MRVCDVCRGMRSLQHEYNNRVMERMCERCDGEGVLADGKPIGPPSGAPPAPNPNPNPFTPGEGARVRLTVLARDVRRLETQIGKYHDELRVAQGKLEGEDVGATEEQALSEFIHQVQQQVRRLRGKAEEKSAEIAALKAGEVADADVEENADDLP